MSEDLAIYLSDPGRVPGIGPERGRRPSMMGVGKYVSSYGSYRYVAYISGQPVSVIQVVSRNKRDALIANVYTLPQYRRQGWASFLLSKIRQDFRLVEHAKDEMLTVSGRAWRKRNS